MSDNQDESTRLARIQRPTGSMQAVARTGRWFAGVRRLCLSAALLGNAWAQAPATTPAPGQLNFGYRIATVRGRAPRWVPTRVFDDGRRTWIDFPSDVGATDMAPLFVITPDGAELVNYRAMGTRYMVDRIFDVAELRLGTRAPVVVRIVRKASRTVTAAGARP